MVPMAHENGLTQWWSIFAGFTAQVLRRLIREVAGAGAPLQPHLRQFLLERCAGGVCLAGLSRSGFDTRRAAGCTLPQAMVSLLSLIPAPNLKTRCCRHHHQGVPASGHHQGSAPPQAASCMHGPQEDKRMHACTHGPQEDKRMHACTPSFLGRYPA